MSRMVGISLVMMNLSLYHEQGDIFQCTCKNCGKPINRYRSFCANFGFPTKKVCPSCGEKVSPEANFGMKRGKSLLLTNEQVKTNDVSK